jgi:DNA-cytosine methyltransferase
MNVLSLFDGMSCGQIALEKLGIPIKNYFAAEIDKYAMQVAKSNYPDMVHLGDVQNIKTSGTHLMDEFDCGHKIDLLIGGSPCQGFSFAGKQLNFDDPRSQLFFEYVRLLKALKPKYFLMENVKMKKESMDIITEYLGVEPIEINSNLVSAQNRKRLYWTNIPMDGLPEDKGIMLKDILEPVEQIDDAYYYSDKSIAYMERGNDKWQQAGARRADRYTQTPDTKKAFTITANFHKGVPYNYFDDVRDKSKCVRSGGRGSYDRHEWDSVDTHHIRKLTVTECERLQTVPDGYTCGVSNTQRYKMLGNGWTVDVVKHIFEGLKETA